jgi:hypothetical protein
MVSSKRLISSTSPFCTQPLTDVIVTEASYIH